MRKVLLSCFLFICLSISSQEKKSVAVMEPIDRQNNVPSYLLSAIRITMETAISHSSEFEAYDRSSLDKVKEEQLFQHSGEVDDSQITALGQLTGVDYILVSEVSGGDGYVMISAKVLDVERGHYNRALDSRFVEMRPQEVQETARDLAKKIFGLSNFANSVSNDNQIKKTALSASNIPRQTFIETFDSLYLSMTWVNGGQFSMGCTEEQVNCENNEKCVRTITLDGYWIGTFEVTQKQWEIIYGTTIDQQCKKAGGNYCYGVGPNFPMYFISWQEAMDFCKKLSEKTGKKYTLPTEAQWEYAARGGNQGKDTRFSGSDNIDDVAWSTMNSNNTTHIIGKKKCNSLEIYDMSGNVWEWCQDWYAPSYDLEDIYNPQGPTQGKEKVNRGGSKSSQPQNCRTSYRNHYNPNARFSYLGFRIVCIP